MPLSRTAYSRRVHMPIEIIWRPFGDGIVRVVHGKIVFPKEPREARQAKVPGVYRLSLNNEYPTLVRLAI